jgi:hypothetical protein
MDSHNFIDYKGGTFMTLSFLVNGHYDAKLVKKIYLKLKALGAIDIADAVFADISIDAVTKNLFDTVEEGPMVSSGSRENLIDKKVLRWTHLGFPFQDDFYWAKLQIFINSDDSFCIWIHFSYEDLFNLDVLDEKFVNENIDRLKKLSFEINQIGDFFYGLFGEESEVYSVPYLIKDLRLLPTDWCFYGAQLLDTLGRAKILSMLGKCKEVKEFDNGNIFFRWTQWNSRKEISPGHNIFKMYLAEHVHRTNLKALVIKNL